jgi:hypothetical protein
MRTIETTAQVEDIRAEIEEFAAEGWDLDPDTGRVEWEDWFDRFERRHDLDLGSDLLSPVIRKVQRIARAAIREA